MTGHRARNDLCMPCGVCFQETEATNVGGNRTLCMLLTHDSAVDRGAHVHEPNRGNHTSGHICIHQVHHTRFRQGWNASRCRCGGTGCRRDCWYYCRGGRWRTGCWCRRWCGCGRCGGCGGGGLWSRLQRRLKGWGRCGWRHCGQACPWAVSTYALTRNGTLQHCDLTHGLTLEETPATDVRGMVALVVIETARTAFRRPTRKERPRCGKIVSRKICIDQVHGALLGGRGRRGRGMGWTSRWRMCGAASARHGTNHR